MLQFQKTCSLFRDIFSFNKGRRWDIKIVEDPKRKWTNYSFYISAHLIRFAHKYVFQTKNGCCNNEQENQIIQIKSVWHSILVHDTNCLFNQNITEYIWMTILRNKSRCMMIEWIIRNNFKIQFKSNQHIIVIVADTFLFNVNRQ